MDLPVPVKHPQFSRSQDGYMGKRTCAKWCLNSMLVMIEALTWSESKSKPSLVRLSRSILCLLDPRLTRCCIGTKQIFSMAPKSTSNESSLASYKLIVLDEADAMTSTAQMALRLIMEKYTANTRFCIIANYTHKLSPALLSRCTRFRFSPLKEQDIRSLVDLVVEKEQVNIQPEAVDSLVTLSKGDMRRALNVLQACHASSMLPSSSSLSHDTNIIQAYPFP